MTPTPSTKAGRELLGWCNRVQYDDRNLDRILAIESDTVKRIRAEFEGRTWHPDDAERIGYILDSIATGAEEDEK